MLEVYLDNKVVFVGTEKEVEEYCNNNGWDYTQNPSYANYERACGIYC